MSNSKEQKPTTQRSPGTLQAPAPRQKLRSRRDSSSEPKYAPRRTQAERSETTCKQLLEAATSSVSIWRPRSRASREGKSHERGISVVAHCGDPALLCEARGFTAAGRSHVRYRDPRPAARPEQVGAVSVPLRRALSHALPGGGEPEVEHRHRDRRRG